MRRTRRSASGPSLRELGRLGVIRRQRLELRIAESLERTTVDARTARADDGRVAGRDVADVRGEAVVRVEGVHPAHGPVATTLATIDAAATAALFVATVHDRSVHRRERAQPEPVDETGLRGRGECGKRLPQPAEVRAAEAVAVDRRGRDDPDGDSRGASDVTARKSPSRPSGETCFESFRRPSGRTAWSRSRS